MRRQLAMLILGAVLAAPGPASRAQLPPNPGLFHSGVWVDEARSAASVCSEADTTVDLYFWAWVPQDDGLTYITLRLVYPLGIFEGSRPEFGPDFSELVIVDYGSGGIEWTLLQTGCPSEWVLLFRQSAFVPGGQRISVSIDGAHSLARDCDFTLHDMNVLGGVSVNGPECSVAISNFTWGAIKRLLVGDPGLRSCHRE